jgi:peptide deformylase
MTMGKVLTLWNEEGINEKDASVLRKKSSDVPAPIDKEYRAAIQILIDSFLSHDDALGLTAP